MKDLKNIITVTINPAIDKLFYVDGLKVDMVNKAKETRITAGSKGINVSRVLKTLNYSSIAVGFKGGRNGKLLCELLSAEGVEFDFTQAAGETRMNTKIVDISGGTFTEINEPGFNLSPEEYNEFSAKLSSIMREGGYITLGGALFPNMPRDCYAEIIRAAKAKNNKTFLDCGGEMLKNGIEAEPYLVKPNIYEFEEMLGKSLDSPKQTALECRQIMAEKQGIEYMIVTLGGDGAVALSKSEGYFVHPAPVKAISTVGAGDTFLAGFMYGIMEGEAFSDSLKIAASCSGAKVAMEDGRVPNKDVLLGYKERVEIEKI